MMPSILLLLLSITVGSTTAFVQPPTIRPIQSSPSPRSLPVLASAKIITTAYTSASAALLFRATKAATKSDASVLITTAALALINLGPTDNANLASAKKACANTPPASAGKAKHRRQAALTWRSVVRIKLVGQLVGVIKMASAVKGAGVMRGAAIIMASNVAFFLCGGGKARHDDDGVPAPMPSGLARQVLGMDFILFGAALLAASSHVGSTRRAVCAGIFSFGALGGAIENLPKFLFGVVKKKE